MKAQNAFGVYIILVSLLSDLAKGKCSSFLNCENCAKNDKCAWCEYENSSKTKCQGNLDPCIEFEGGKKIVEEKNCKEYCNFSPCDQCAKRSDCHWCMSDEKCREKSEDLDCEFGIVEVLDMCYLTNFRKQWVQYTKRMNKEGHEYRRRNEIDYFHGTQMLLIGIFSGLAFCCTGIFFWCCCKNINSTPSNDKTLQKAETEVNDFVPPANPKPLQQKHPQPKKEKTKNDGVCIVLSPVTGSDNECFEDEKLQPKGTPTTNQHSEGRSERKQK